MSELADDGAGKRRTRRAPAPAAVPARKCPTEGQGRGAVLLVDIPGAQGAERAACLPRAGDGGRVRGKSPMLRSLEDAFQTTLAGCKDAGLSILCMVCFPMSSDGESVGRDCPAFF